MAVVRSVQQLEGIHRQSHRYGDGGYHDEHSHGVLEADFLRDFPPTGTEERAD